MNRLKILIPVSIKEIAKKVFLKIKQNKKIYYCPVCKSKISGFNRLSDEFFQEFDNNQFIQSIFCAETFNFLKYQCKKCGASDRDRLYALFLEQKLVDTIDIKIIDFAPSSVSKTINNLPGISYISADLLAKDVDLKIDIQDMNIIEENQFDAFICSHILEHVQNDTKAIRELFRIIKPGGWGILMVPVFLNLMEDYEDSNIVSESDRWRHFGQFDHVRAYSKSGFITKIKNAGFELSQLDVNYFGKQVFMKCGINSRSVLYIVKKND